MGTPGILAVLYRGQGVQEGSLGNPVLGILALGIPEVGIPELGIPELGIPELGIPELGILERDQAPCKQEAARNSSIHCSSQHEATFGRQTSFFSADCPGTSSAVFRCFA